MDAARSNSRTIPAAEPSKGSLSALDRALEGARAWAPVVVRLGPDRVAVPSRSRQGGDWHVVVADGRRLRCDCPGWAHREACIHYAAAVLAWAGELPLLDPPPAPVAHGPTAPEGGVCGPCARGDHRHCRVHWREGSPYAERWWCDCARCDEVYSAQMRGE